MASQFINLKSRLLNPYVVFAVWMLCTVWICITQSLAGPQNYNNFLVFRGVFDFTRFCLKFSENRGEKRRFSAAVRADEADTFAIGGEHRGVAVENADASHEADINKA